MKRKHLILQYKLKEIETKYQYIFVFHCSGLTNTQWRQFKHLLSKTQSNTLFQPNLRGKLQLNSSYSRQERCRRTISQEYSAKFAPKLTESVLRAEVLQSEPALYAPSYSDSLRLYNSKLTPIPGPFCIVYSTQQTLQTLSYTTLAPWLELVKQIQSFEHKANLVLVYGQLNSTRINHIDIKHAMNLETKSVLELFLWSIHYSTQHFQLCLNQGKRNSIQSVTHST
uniref:Ribosomal protein L10 n=1 Tax=Zygnema circumcarinatum TaxID=35869 RepID=A0A6N0GXI1_ZYGCR|nr:ribosomal protein L10 [Zygnema circumcarinatum]QKQ14691.1 ribosomal protein L10 [Zygnema circumcarinatum]WEL36336.1 ribosomal protein L10 [Zygnema circumcarinatum]